jgi:hypothetical protein
VSGTKVRVLDRLAAKHCLACRQELRDLRATARNAIGHGDPARSWYRSEAAAAVIDRLYELGGPLPERINEKRRRLALRSRGPKAKPSRRD